MIKYELFKDTNRKQNIETNIVTVNLKKGVWPVPVPVPQCQPGRLMDRALITSVSLLSLSPLLILFSINQYLLSPNPMYFKEFPYFGMQ